MKATSYLRDADAGEERSKTLYDRHRINRQKKFLSSCVAKGGENLNFLCNNRNDADTSKMSIVRKKRRYGSSMKK